MKFIEEIVVEEFLPTIRAMLAEDLRDRGFTQHEVAEALGISQSAVSKYAHGDVARHDRIVADERVRELVDRIGEGLAAGDVSRVAALVESEILSRQREEDDLLADLHEEAMPELADANVEFAVHDPDNALRERERVLASVRRGLRTLRNASGFAALIPNVGANVVEALPDAETIDDVAGVPGRLVDVKGRAMVPGEPEFGVSEHVASVLLAARAAGVPARGAVNVRYDPDLLEAMGTEYETIAFDAEEHSPTAVRAALEGRDVDIPVVLYQTGAVGVEPIVYVLAGDAVEAARIVREYL